MALIIENGTIVTGANSYITEAAFTAWAADRAVTLTGDIEASILEAADYLETLAFIGAKKTKEQPLQWPRTGVYIDGFEYADTEIPDELKTAQYAIALSIAQGINPMGAITRAVKREKVDVLEVEYADNAAAVDISRSIGRSLRKLVEAGGFGGVNFRVIRG